MTTEPQAVSLAVQRATRESFTPSDDELTTWASAAVLKVAPEPGQWTFDLSIRIVDEAEGRELNARYRGKDSATNVLSFPSDLPPSVCEEMETRSGSRVLGDLLICAPVVNKEAVEQGKNGPSHWAHLVVHGVLHLFGHDHLESEQAETMEALETDILESLGIPDPYREQ